MPSEGNPETRPTQRKDLSDLHVQMSDWYYDCHYASS